MSLAAEIPLFPLDVVLFPNMVLPLHIFEQRYRRLLTDCLDSGEPFGLVRAREDGAPHRIGTAAHIVRVEGLPDGRSNIVVIGQERFAIDGLRFHKPYLVARVSEMEMPGAAAPDALRLLPVVQQGLTAYLVALKTVVGQPVPTPDIPDEADALGYMVATILQVGASVKQSLLEAESVAEMLRLERRLLETETGILRYMERTSGRADDAGPATPN
ncbi:MAG: LON peptidase substrate-binding domain-containing protein [Anaerolineae bacterium]